MALSEFQQLNKETVAEYIKATPCLTLKLRDKLDDMQVQVVEDGFINLVFIIKSFGGSMVIKQSLPYVRCIGESWPISKERAKFESKALQIYGSLSPSHVPELYHFDPCLSVIAMQYLEPPHILLREGLISRIEYPFLAENISEFFAEVFFHTSRLFMSITDHRRAVADYCGNVEMTSLMEQLSFSPFEESKHINWTSPELDFDVKAVLEDNVIKFQVAQLKSMFCERTQALIHADFHAGSIMVTENSVKVIDPEFAFYGPMGYDIGVFFRNLLVSFFIHNDCQNYKKWLMSTLEETWILFVQKFIKLWDQHKNGSGEVNTELRKLLQRKYIEDVFQDALGFCATYMLRSVIHIFSVDDFDAINDVKKRAECERNTLYFGKMLLKERKRFHSIDVVVSSLQQYMH